MAVRGVNEGTQEVDTNEQIVFTLNVITVGSTSGVITNPTMLVTRLSDGEDVTKDVTEGDMAVLGQIITLKKIKGLAKGEQYRVDVRYNKDGNNLENEIIVDCPRRRE